MNKRQKTPLRYAGGKSKAIYKLEKHLPPNMNEVNEIQDCFLGGGSFPIYLTKLARFADKKFKVNELYFPVYNFWRTLQEEGHTLSDKLLELKRQHNTPEKARVEFDKQKKILDNESSSNFDKAVAFYMLNKCGFSGLVTSSFSAMASESNFGENGIIALKYYSDLIKDKWEIYNMDYKDFVKTHSNKKDVFLYLDPPYMIKDNLYGKKGELHKVFKHEEFFVICPALKCKQLISYNSDNLIKDAFSHYNVRDYDLTYTMRSTGTYMEDQKDRKELAIRNY
jgi:site-specific DNA-adenine methylase